MSISKLQTATAALPYNLREQVLGYARAVDLAAPDIARDAGIELTPRLRDQLAFVAGLRKLYALTAGSYWAIDNAAVFLERRDVSTVSVGRTDYSRGGELHRGLQSTLTDFDTVVRQYDMVAAIDGSYADVLRRLAHES